MLDIDSSLAVKYEMLLTIIRDLGSVGVAFSGGTDSSFLLKAANTALGRPVSAFFAESTLLAADEKKNAREIAKIIGGKLHIQEADPLFWPEFVANPPDRCYYCKKKIYSLFHARMKSLSIHSLLDGTNTDDLMEDRPGILAARELGVRSPLKEAELSKREIRSLSRKLGLPTWDAVSASCLATRIPTGAKITAEKLNLIEKCEKQLKCFGYFGCRVRLFDSSVRIELCEDELARFITSNDFIEIKAFIESQGIEKVLLDLTVRKCLSLVTD